MCCVSEVFSVTLQIGRSEVAVLAKIESGGSPGFNLDFYQMIWKCSHAVPSCPVSNGGKKAYLHLVDLFSAGSGTQLAAIGFVFHAHAASKEVDAEL